MLGPQANRILDADVAECRRAPQVPSSTGRYWQNPVPSCPEGCPDARKPLESRTRAGKFPERSNRELNRPIREPNPPNREAPENSKLERDCVWEAIWAELRLTLRERVGREASPSAPVLDSQSVKSLEKEDGTDNQVGYDPGKQAPEGGLAPQ